LAHRAAGRGGAAGVARRVTGAIMPGSGPTRILLLYAQDHKGLGHITRTLTIARHVLAAYPSAVAYVATESPITRDFVLPERCDYVKLPTRQGAPRPRPGAGDAADDARFRRLRAQLLREVALGLAPDLVLVDHEPLGHKGEFRDGLCALKERSPDTKFVFGLRDIMDDIGRIRAQWQELGVYDALEHVYDGIAVYGQPDLFDVADAYAIPQSVRPKLHYCGYVVRDVPTVDPAHVRRRYRARHGRLQQRDRSVGGGAAAGDRAARHPQGRAADPRRDAGGAGPGAVGASQGLARGRRPARRGARMGAAARSRGACAPGARDHPGVRRGEAAHCVSGALAGGRLMDALATPHPDGTALT